MTFIYSKESKILDIGCGLGQTMVALKDLGYNDVDGVDIDDHAVKYCKSSDLHVRKIKDLVSFCKKTNKKYDFLIMSHVLEHIPKDEIILTLKCIKEHLMNEGAKILINVPNAQSNTGSYWAYEDFTHTTLFTTGSLEFVLKAADFSEYRFIDIDSTDSDIFLKRIVKKFFLMIYKRNLYFWNKITSTSFHKQSVDIYSYEIKLVAYNN